MRIHRIGSKVHCSIHSGTLLAYFTADGETYGVVRLDNPYMVPLSDGGQMHLALLNIHSSNLDPGDYDPETSNH